MELVGKPPALEDVISAHHDLTGLEDDDHPQYQNETRGDARYWRLATDLATQAELDAHVDDATDAHDASAISVLDTGGYLTAVNVETAIAEVVGLIGGGGAALSAHLADTDDAHDASAISVLDTAGGLTATNVEDALAEIDAQAASTASGLSAHISDISAAHEASAISYGGGPGISATNVEDALDELAAEKLDVAGVIQSGDAAGGALDGTYPNPGLAASVAGNGLLETSNVLSVRTDGSTLEISSDIVRVKDLGITSGKLASNAVTTAKITDANVTEGKIATGAVSAGKLATNSVQTVKIVDLAVTEAKIGNGAVTPTKLSFDPATQVELDAHVNDTDDAHDASAISILDTGGNYAATNVEAALTEIAASGNAALADHLADTTDAHDASAISFATMGNYSATTVQAALEELDADIDGIVGGGTTPTGSAGGVLGGTYPNPSFAVDMATQAELDAHNHKRLIQITATDPNASAALSVSDGVAYFIVPLELNGWIITSAHAAVVTVSSSGTVEVQLHNVTDAVDILSTKITVDASERTSYTADVAPVINTLNDDLATGDVIRVDIDGAGTNAKGLVILLTTEAP